MFILCNQQSICDQKYILFCFLIKSFLLNWIHTPWHFVNCAKVYLDHWKHPPSVLGDDHLVGEALELAPQAAVLQLDPGLLEAGVLGCGVGGGQAEAEVVRGHAAAAAAVDTLHTGVSLHAPLSPLVPTCQLSRCHRWFRAEAAISAMSWEMFALGSPEINWGDSAAESAPRPALATRPQLRGSWPGAAALVAGSGYRAMVAAAAEAPEPEAGMGTGSGLAWPGRMWRWCWWRISRISGRTSPLLSAVSRRNLYPTGHHQWDAAATGAGDKEHCLQWRHGAMTTANPTHRRYPITITTADRAGAGPCPEPSPQLRSPRLVSTWHPVPVTVVITSVVTRGRADLRPPSDLHCWHCLADHKTTDWLNQNCFTARNQNIYLGPGTDQKAIKNLNLRAGQSMWFGRSKGLNCIVQREKITYLRLILSSSGRWSKKVFILWQHFPRSWENIHWQ